MRSPRLSAWCQQPPHYWLGAFCSLITLFIVNIAHADVESGGSGPYVVLIGAPGAGKSSNAASLADEYGIPAIDMGEAVTEEIQRASRRSVAHMRGGTARSAARAKRSARLKQAHDKLNAGELVSDDTLNAIVASRILHDDARNGFVLDGYPGSEDQAEFLDALLEANEVGALIVIHLDVPDAVALERMKSRGRADDEQGFAEERLRQFRANIAPILNYYEDDGLAVIDATPALLQVERDVLTAVKEKNK